jgi:hypothetical protein
LSHTLVAEEVKSQTKAVPVSCRPSRHGARTETGEMTWIVSFLQPIQRRFQLFGQSGFSKLVEKSPRIQRHENGCQGYCVPSRCTRLKRCSNCGVLLHEHQGEHGNKCIAKARCANCYGPEPAGHEKCPAKPFIKSGKIVRLSRKELHAIRKTSTALSSPTPGPELESPASEEPAQPVQSPHSRQSRKRGLDEEEPRVESPGSPVTLNHLTPSSSGSAIPSLTATTSRARRQMMSRNYNEIANANNIFGILDNESLEQETMDISP